MNITQSSPAPFYLLPRVILWSTAALALVFACLTSPYYLFGSDPARYVELGRSIAHGQGYFYFGQPERYFPPGFPLALVPAALLGGSFAAMARWAAVIAAFVFPATYAFARTRTAALPIAVLTIGSAGFLELVTGNPRSEPLYMVATLALLAWAHQGLTRPEGTHRSAAFVTGGAALLLMAVAARSIGIAAVGAVAMVVLEGVVRPQANSRRLPLWLVIPLLTGVVFLGLWFAWARLTPNVGSELGNGGTYLDNMRTIDPHRPELGGVTAVALLSRVARNFGIQLSHAAELLTQLPWIKRRWFSPLSVAILGLTLAGLWTELRRPSRLGAWYFLGYGAILLLWPYDEGTRFLVPILPLLWVFVIVGARQLIAAAAAGNRILRLGLIALGTACLVGAGITLRTIPADFSRQDQAFTLVWLLVVGVALLAWDRVVARIGASSSRFGRVALIGGLVLYAAAGVARTIPQVLAQDRQSRLADPVTEGVREASRWIADNTRPDASIQTTFPVPIQFAAGRKARKFPTTSSPEELRQSLEQVGPDFLIVFRDSDNPYYQPEDSEKFAILQRLFPDAWREVARLKGSTIYAFRK